MVSIGNMLKKLEGCIGMSDLSEWEERFVLSCLGQCGNGRDTSKLSEKQVEKIQELHNKNFGG